MGGGGGLLAVKSVLAYCYQISLKRYTVLIGQGYLSNSIDRSS